VLCFASSHNLLLASVLPALIDKSNGKSVTKLTLVILALLQCYSADMATTSMISAATPEMENHLKNIPSILIFCCQPKRQPGAEAMTGAHSRAGGKQKSKDR
jgi:hypothetical protein